MSDLHARLRALGLITASGVARADAFVVARAHLDKKAVATDVHPPQRIQAPSFSLLIGRSRMCSLR